MRVTRVHSENAYTQQYALVRNGMEGQIAEIVDTQQCSILFTNLTLPQIIHTSNLTRTTRVSRELHKCLCGQNGDLFCTRCNMMWYCSAKCQADDYDRHKIGCKAMVSEFGLLSLRTKNISKKNGFEQEEDSNDEEI
jgi:hypothetical protein